MYRGINLVTLAVVLFDKYVLSEDEAFTLIDTADKLADAQAYSTD